MRRKDILALTALLITAVALPATTSAQTGLSVSALAGAYVPAGSFHELETAAGELQRGSTLGLGLNVHLGMLRGSIAYATGAKINEDGVTGETEIGDGSVLAATADLVFQPLPQLAIVRPYLLGGLGYKRESYSAGEEGFPDELDDSSNKLVGHLGVGVDISLGGLSLVAEISDFIGRDNNDDWKVHDAFGMVGLKFKVF